MQQDDGSKILQRWPGAIIALIIFAIYPIYLNFFYVNNGDGVACIGMVDRWTIR